MPTGYTAKLMGEGQEFKEFILTCARGMGACIMQRDDPMDQPPALQEPNKYYKEALKKAQDRLASLNSMSIDEARAQGKALKQEAVNSAKNSVERNEKENARLYSMERRVREWSPPTKDHEGLKEFMLQQLSISKNSDYANTWLREAMCKDAEEYFSEDLAKAARDVVYYEEEYKKEVERTKARNGWIKRLYESIS